MVVVSGRTRPRANRLGRYPSSRAASRTRCLVEPSISALSFSARDTVCRDTPAERATSWIVTRRGSVLLEDTRRVCPPAAGALPRAWFEGRPLRRPGHGVGAESPGLPFYATAVDLAALLDRIADDVAPEVGRGAVADYIPALARVEPWRFGMAVAEVDGAVDRGGGRGRPVFLPSMV